MTIIWFVTLLHALKSLKITNTNPNALILPQTDNAIAPFSLELEADADNTTKYDLQVKCADEVKTNLEFTRQHPEFCTKDSYTDTIANLNDMLQGTYVKLVHDNDKPTDLIIIYTIKPETDAQEPLSFTQELLPATIIPINVVNKVIYYQPKSSTAFDLKVLEIQELYYHNAQTHELSIVLNNNGFPDWIEYKFQGSELYFRGRTPVDLERTFSFIFMIQDRQTGLFSESVGVDVSNSLDKRMGGKKTLVIVLFLIFTGGIACILLIILVSLKKKQPTQNLQMDVTGPQNQFQNATTANVLSDSIVQWNKKLVERHKTKNYDFIETDDKTNSPYRSPGFAYEQFDDTFEISDEEKNPDIKISDRLSEIRPDDDKKKSNGNRSSFFDDIRF